jgi:hypothetical protein
MTRKEIEAELIALTKLRVQRHPSLLIQFVATGDDKVAYPERKCTCKAPLAGIAFCYCFSSSDDDSARRNRKG